MQATLNFINSLSNKMLIVINIITLVVVFSCNNNSNDVSIKQQADNKNPVTSVQKVKTILFFGNSLTAGYGVDPSEAFPSLIQDRIDSLKLNYKVINAGVSGETSAGGNGRISWILKQPVDIFVLELGGNDGLRGIPLKETTKNLQAIIDSVKAKYPEARLMLAGMQIPPNMGLQYATEFKNIFPALAARNNITLIPFLLQGVGGEVKLNQQDGIHPTPEGHRIVANNVWNVLKDIL
jgi:acyl-CoA thioesterase-1